MDMKAFDEILVRTLDDQALSRSEEAALREVVREGIRSTRDKDLVRARIFDVGARGLDDPVARARIAWLAKLVRLLETRDEDEAAAQEVYFSPGEACVRRITGLIDGAKTSLDICVYTMTDDRIAKSLLAAHARKVPVRIVTDNEKEEDPGSDTRRLAAAGIPVAVDRSPYHMHHKFAIVDRRVLVNGSYNWTRGAADSNEENLVVSADSALIRAFSAEFEKLWEKFAR